MVRAQTEYVDSRVTVTYVGTVLKFIGVAPSFWRW